MVAQQTIYNRRWIEKNRDKYISTALKHSMWKSISLEFRRIGIYDSIVEKRGRPCKINNK